MASALFLNQQWYAIGIKSSQSRPVPSDLPRLNRTLLQITGLPEQILEYFDPMKELNIKRNMTWMQNRHTTRPEDQCYSMLGIFAVYLLPIYGERTEHAFKRLIKEIWNEHGSNSTIEDSKFHLLSSSYQETTDYQHDRCDVKVWDLRMKLPRRIFCLREHISGTIYTVIKRKRTFMKIYEDGTLGETLGMSVRDYNVYQARIRADYESAGTPEVQEFRNSIRVGDLRGDDRRGRNYQVFNTSLV